MTLRGSSKNPREERSFDSLTRGVILVAQNCIISYAPKLSQQNIAEHRPTFRLVQYIAWMKTLACGWEISCFVYHSIQFSKYHCKCVSPDGVPACHVQPNKCPKTRVICVYYTFMISAQESSISGLSFLPTSVLGKPYACHMTTITYSYFIVHCRNWVLKTAWKQVMVWLWVSR